MYVATNADHQSLFGAIRPDTERAAIPNRDALFVSGAAKFPPTVGP